MASSDPADHSRRLEALVHADPDFIALAGIDGRIEFVNQAGRELVGFEGPDVSAYTIADFLTEHSHAQSLMEERPSVIDTGRWNGVSEMRDWRGGPPIPVEVTSFLVSDTATGEPLALATIRRDLRPTLTAGAAVTQARAALVASEQRSRSLLLHMSDLLLVLGMNGQLTYASPSAGRELGYPEGTFVGKDVLQLVHPEDLASVEAAIAQLAAEPERPAVLEVRLRSAAGDYRHYEAVTNNVSGDDAVGGILVVGRDVTDRHRSDQARRSEATVLELIATEAPVGRVLDAMAQSVEQQLDGIRCTVLLAGVSTRGPVFEHGAAPSMPPLYRQVLEGQLIAGHPSPCGLAAAGDIPVLSEDLLDDDRFIPLRELAKKCDVRAAWSFPVHSPTTNALLGTFALYRTTPGLPDEETMSVVRRASRLVGITLDRQLLLSRLAHQAEHDGLTGLPNRSAMLSLLSRALRPGLAIGGSPVVLYLDLDRLKVVNDSLGHEVGDELLVRVARHLSEVIPESATVGRFGGDEFVVLLGSDTDVAQVTEQILTAVATPVQLAGRTITPAASAGVVYAAPGQSAVDVLRDADIAMYRSMHSGGASYTVYTEDMGRRAFDRLDLESQIRHGIGHDEFRVHYQPVVDLTRADALVGFEALVRWEHPRRGLLAPAAFIDLAEETGLIVDLGEWVLHQVVSDVRRWSREQPDFAGSLSVNVAARQLGSDALVGVVADAISAMDPWSLSLELTESTVMGDTEASRSRIEQLADTGARLAIDDFGTGFSSLSYLARLPVHVLKIDRSFVNELGSPGADAVATAVVNLAHGLQLDVVAEGIETGDQHSALVAMGCLYGQGYLMGRPLVDADAVARIAEMGRLGAVR